MIIFKLKKCIFRIILTLKVTNNIQAKNVSSPIILTPLVTNNIQHKNVSP